MNLNPAPWPFYKTFARHNIKSGRLVYKLDLPVRSPIFLFSFAGPSCPLGFPDRGFFCAESESVGASDLTLKTSQWTLSRSPSTTPGQGRKRLLVPNIASYQTRNAGRTENGFRIWPVENQISSRLNNQRRSSKNCWLFLNKTFFFSGTQVKVNKG